MKKTYLRKAIHSLFLALCFSCLFAFAGTVSVKAAETTFREGQLLVWRFDEGQPNNSIRMYTKNLPLTFTTSFANNASLPSSNEVTDFSYVSYGTLSQTIASLQAAGYIISGSIVSAEGTNRLINAAAGANDYLYVGNPDVSDGLILSDGYIKYDVDFAGNALLVPVEAIDYCYYSQGAYHRASSGGVSKLMYAIEDPKTTAEKVSWNLCTNTVTVRVKGTYTYTRLIPLTTVHAEGYLTCSHTCDNPSHTGVNAHTISSSYVVPATYFESPCREFISGSTVTVKGQCPVYSVQESIEFYRDIECFVIKTDTLQSAAKDKNVYVKDVLSDNAYEADYRFENVKKQSFNVKYDVQNGLVASGLTRNDGVYWANGSNQPVLSGGVNGEVIEWWPAKCDYHYYTTPSTINQDIDIMTYSEYGVSLYFTDANAPDKVIKIKIPTQRKAPKVTIVANKYESPVLSGLKPNNFAIRVYRNGSYITMPSSLFADNMLGDSYLYNKDIAEAFNNPSFYTFAGGPSGKEKVLYLTSLFGLANNKGFNVIPEHYIESQFTGTNGKLPSAVAVTHINAQNIFNVGSSEDHESIILTPGKIKILGASANNAYEFFVEGVSKSWTRVASTKEVGANGLTDGSVVYVRKAATTTTGSTSLASSYVTLTYDGHGVGLPNIYYMEDFYQVKAGQVTLTGIGSNINDVYVNNILQSRSASITLSDVFTTVKYSLQADRLVSSDDYAMYVTLVSGSQSYTYEHMLGHRDSISTPDLIDEADPEYTFNVQNIISYALSHAPATFLSGYTGIYDVYVDFAKHSEHTGESNFAISSGQNSYVIQGTVTPDDEYNYTYTFEDSTHVMHPYFSVNLLRYMMRQEAALVD